MIDEQRVFLLADGAVNDAIAQVSDGQWQLPIPDWFQLFEGADRTAYTLRRVVSVLAYDEAWVPASLAGRPASDKAGMPAYTDDVLGDDPRASFAALHDAAVAAVEGVTDLDQVVHFSYGDYPVREALPHLMSFRGFRAWDIAKMIGADTTLPDELVQGMWDELSPQLDQWRAFGVFPPALPIPDGSSLQDRLLLSVGRQP